MSSMTESANEPDASALQEGDNIVLTNERNQSEQQQQHAKESNKLSEQSDLSDPKVSSKCERVSLPRNLMKALRRSSSSVIGSNSSGSGNNSDNSALLSIGNGSFGFNFDCDEMNNNSDGKTNDSDSDGNSPPKTEDEGDGKPKAITGGSGSGANRDWKSSVSSLTQQSDSDNKVGHISHNAAAAAAVANLHSIANAYSSTEKDDEAETQSSTAEVQPSQVVSSLPTHRGKRAAPDMEDQDSGGYNSDGDGEPALSCAASSTSSINAAARNVAVSHSQKPVPTHTSSSHAYIESNSTITSSNQHGRSRKKPKKLDEGKREERNAREKERSFRISKQINELRNLLSSGGVVVPKGTKSSVLTEAANYIRMLQQHQYRSEIDRHQLVQQMQMIGGGALGPQASNAIRHVAAQNGVWSLGNFGGVPPKSAMTYYQGTQGLVSEAPPSQDAIVPLSANVEEHDYRFVFNSSPVGMAIASMGGAFIDCNNLFCQLSNYTKQEVCSMTIFNMTSRQDLEQAFDLISQMISPPSDGRPTNQKPKPCVLRGSMKNRDDLGLSVALIRGDDGIAKCFCVTLINNPDSPFDTSRPTPATADLQIPTISTAKDGPGRFTSGPAYTTG